MYRAVIAQEQSLNPEDWGLKDVEIEYEVL